MSGKILDSSNTISFTYITGKFSNISKSESILSNKILISGKRQGRRNGRFKGVGNAGSERFKATIASFFAVDPI